MSSKKKISKQKMGIFAFNIVAEAKMDANIVAEAKMDAMILITKKIHPDWRDEDVKDFLERLLSSGLEKIGKRS